MARNLSTKTVHELRQIAISYGANPKRLYGTSRQALIVIINRLEGIKKAGLNRI